MLIDWFTVGAQALNFIILAWLLKRFLYQPVLDAIDAREQRIAGQLADAAANKTAAQKERDEFGRKNEEFAGQRAELLRKATDEAAAERARLLEEARKAADSQRATLQEALRSDAASLDEAVRLRTQNEVFAVARKLLTELAGTSLDERMAAVFIQRLESLDATTKAALGSALAGAAEPALLRSAFELPAAPRAAIQTALNHAFSTEVRLRFVTAPDLVGGLELIANGQKLAWSIAAHLTSLAHDVDELLKPGATRP